MQPSKKEVASLLGAGSLGAATGISSDVRAIGGRKFIEGTFPLFRDCTTDIGHLVLLQDWSPTQAFLDQLRSSLLFAGIGGFVLALAGGIFFSHRTSQPLMDMAAAARDIAGGDWSRTVPARGSAEATTMANAFNAMTRSLRDQSDRRTGAVPAVFYGHTIRWRRHHLDRRARRHHILGPQRRSHVRLHGKRGARTADHYVDRRARSRDIQVGAPGTEGKRPTLGHIIEVTGLRKDGKQFPSEFSLAALNLGEGTAFTAVVRDVLERQQSQDTLRQREEQLRQAQKMEAIGRLAGGVAHDFNNLLMAIHGYAEMLVQNLAYGDERRTDAEEIIKAAERAAGLTRQLLAFSSRQVITQQAVALDQLVQNMQNMLQRLIGADIQISTKTWPDLTPVLADTTQVEQILVNLVIYARDAMPRGGKSASS